MDSIREEKYKAMINYKKAQFLFIHVVVYSLAAFLSSLFILFLIWFPSLEHLSSIYLPNPNIYSSFSSSKFLFILGNIIVIFLIGESKLRSPNPKSSTSTEIYDEYVLKSRSVNLTRKWTSTNNINKDVITEVVRTRTQVSRQLETVRSCNMIQHAHDLTVSKGSIMPRTRDQSKRQKKRANAKITTIKDCELKADVNSIIVELNDLPDEPNEMKLQASSEDGQCNGKEEVRMDVDRLERQDLNRRVEEFIARVSRRRMLETRQLVDVED